MDYTNLYVNLLLKHGTEEKPSEMYYERHHIIPKALGGSNLPENLIYLPARVHFIVHWLLYKIHKNATMARAFYGMCDFERKPERYRPSSRVYAIAKEAFSTNSHMKQEVHRKRQSVISKAQWQDSDKREKLLTGFLPMFNDKTHAMFMKGKTGEAHPRSRQVNTPYGVFGSVREAGRALTVAHNIISRRCKSNDTKYAHYFYLD